MTHFKLWLKAAGIRALKTFAQTCVGVIGACAMLSDVSWQTALWQALQPTCLIACAMLCPLASTSAMPSGQPPTILLAAWACKEKPAASLPVITQTL